MIEEGKMKQRKAKIIRYVYDATRTATGRPWCIINGTEREYVPTKELAECRVTVLRSFESTEGGSS